MGQGSNIKQICRLDTNTQRVYEKALEDSLGDEGYAAWLQYREIQRFKRDRQALLTEEVDSKEGKDAGAKKESGWVMVNGKEGVLGWMRWEHFL